MSERAYLLEHVTPLEVPCIEHGVQAGQYCNMLAGSCCAARTKIVTEGWQQVDYVETDPPYYYVSQEDENGEPIKTLGEYPTISEAIAAFPNAVIGDSTLYDAPDVDPGLYGPKIRANRGLEFWRSKTLLNEWTLDRLDPSKHPFKIRDRYPETDICGDCGHPRSKHA